MTHAEGGATLGGQVLAVDDLQPTAPIAGVPHEVQAESMRLLRRMRYVPEHPHEFPDQLVAWASSHSLSRQDMAVAAGLSVEQISNIIRETAERDQHMKAHTLQAQCSRHMPQ